jgi:hypothetical protein
LGDTDFEGDETVVVTLSGGSSYTVGSPSSATVTIADHSPAPTFPGKAVLTSPSGSIVTATPTYTWNAVSNSPWYLL